MQIFLKHVYPSCFFIISSNMADCALERWVIYGAEAELQVWGTDCSAQCSAVVSAFPLQRI